MKTRILAAAAFAGLASAPLPAQPAGTPANPPSTRAEMQQSIQTRFAARDANHDGFLTPDELGEIDRYASDSGIDLWRESSDV